VSDNNVNQETPVRSADNTLGLIGFITSLVGFFGTCGMLSPVGAILSFIAIFNRPRGFAVAGLVIGLIGSFGFIFWGLAIIVLVLGAIGVTLVAAPEIQTELQIDHAGYVIKQYVQEHDVLPDDVLGGSLITGDDELDGWEHSLRYSRIGDGKFEIRSAGPDSLFETADDVSEFFDVSIAEIEEPGM